MSSHIIAQGGGSFAADPKNLLIDRYIVAQAGSPSPAIAFLPQASGESLDYIVKFYATYSRLGCQVSHLSLFTPHTADLEGYLLEQDIIYVGGGNTKSMLALWREWGIDAILRKAWEKGVILCGVSAGANCWFEQCTTDSIPGPLTVLDCMGFLKGSCTPHYDGEEQRIPTVKRVVASGEMLPGYAFDNCVAGHFVDGKFATCVSARPEAKGYFVDRVGNEMAQTTLETRFLSSSV